MYENIVKKDGKDVSQKKGNASDLPFFQSKLSINAPGDEYEQEADTMADSVMRMADPAAQPFFSPKSFTGPHLHRKCRECEEEDKLKRKENSGKEQEANSSVENYIISLNSSGSRLDKSTRTFFEPRFGYDFSEVKIHNDAPANESARSINALAYTHGNHIVFGANQFSSGSDAGKKLLTHELTHVVQQDTGEGKKIQRDVGWAATGRPYGPPLTGSANTTVTETISNAPFAYSAWNNTYSWSSRFDVVYDLNSVNVLVIMKLFSSAIAAVKSFWKQAIEGKWSKKFSFAEYDDSGKEISRKPILVNIQWVDSAADAHYSITPSSTGMTSGGRSGIGGTSSMLDWGTADSVDVTHEFGHMLGNAEEYFTTNGVDYSRGGLRQGFRDPGGDIMNNPAGNPTAAHFELVRKTIRDTIFTTDAKCKIV